MRAIKHFAVLGCFLAALALQPAIASITPDTLKGEIEREQSPYALARALYLRALKEDDVSGLIAALADLSESSSPLNTRAKALTLSGIILWQRGEVEDAEQALQEANTLASSRERLQLYVALLMATGQSDKAMKIAGKSDDLTFATEQALLADAPDALTNLTEHSSYNVLNIARLLAVKGNSAAALDLLEHLDDPASSAMLAADWALSAKQYKQAAEFAWLAYEHTEVIAEQRYALALYTEAWRLAQDLPKAQQWLAAQPQSLEITQVRIDILLELGDYQQALAITRASDEPAIIARQASLLELADRTDELAALYKEQILRQPQDNTGYIGLAGLYVNAGDSQNAKRVFYQLVENNPNNTALLLDTARQMIAMGLTEEAINLVSLQSDGDDTAQQVRQFLFETYLASGDEAKAQTVLEDMLKRLPQDSLSRLQVAENYERLQLPKTAFNLLRAVEKARGALGYDQQLHMAALAYSTGETEAALQRWQQLWQLATLPARRQYLENRIISVSRETNQLSSRAQSLAEKLKQGRASVSEGGLLVRIYLAQDKRDEALGVIQALYEQGAINEIEMLNMQAQVYGKVRDYIALNQVWKQLAERDGANADSYWQQITLNTLRNHVRETSQLATAEAPTDFTGSQTRTVEALLVQLKAVSPALTDSAFAASIYTMAGLPQQAERLYRQAVLENDEDADSLLQLVQLLKQQGQISRAITQLQYVILFAQSDSLRSAAIDGLLNLTSADNSEREDAVSMLKQQTLIWLKGRLLAQLIEQNEPTATLYTLIDVAQQLADFEMVEQINRQLAAGNAAMRPTILRGLVTLFSGTKDENATGPVFGNSDKKQLYGRRLLVLKPLFPPAFYADLADTLLAEGHQLEAEQAFALITDIPGLVNVKQIKGDAFARIGQAQRALANYRQALVTDQSNIGLLLKAAVLETQTGNAPIAHYWYWQGITHLLNQLPLRLTGTNEQKFLEYHRYGGSLTEGLLLTWPSSVAEKKARLAQLLEQIQQTIEQSDLAQNGNDLSDFPRLQAYWQLVQAVAFSQRESKVAQTVTQQLLNAFSADPEFMQHVMHTDLIYGHWQASLNYQVKDASWPMQALMQQAQDAQNFPLQLAVGLSRQNWPLVTALIEQVVAAHNNAAPGIYQQSLRHQYYSALLKTLQNMPLDDFMQHVWPVFSQSENWDSVLFNLLRSQPAYYQKIERFLQAKDQALLSEQVLVALTVQQSANPIPSGLFSADAGPGFLQTLTKRLSIDQLIGLYQQFQDQLESTNEQAYLQPELLEFLLHKPLNAIQQEQLQSAMVQAAGYSVPGQAVSVAGAIRWLNFSVYPDNQGLVVASVEAAAMKCSECEVLADVARNYFAGDKLTAYQQLLQLRRGASSNYALGAINQLVERYFANERQLTLSRFFERVEYGEEISTAELNKLVEQVVRTMPPSPQLLTIYQRLYQLKPQNSEYLAGLLTLQWQQQKRTAFTTTLANWLETHPNEDHQKLLWIARQLASEVEVANGQVENVFNSTTALTDWLNRSRSGLIESLYVPVFGSFAQQYANLDIITRFNQMQRAQQLTPAGKPQLTRLVTRLAALFKTNPKQAVAQLNTLWRNGYSGQKQFDDSGMDRDLLLHTRFDLNGEAIVNEQQDKEQSARGDLLQSMAALPDATALYQRWLLALPDAERFAHQRLYNLIVAGWQQQGQLKSNMERLFQQLSADVFTAHDLQLLVTALSSDAANADATQIMTLLNAARSQPLMTPATRIHLSQLFARQQLFDVAGELLNAAFWQLQHPAPTLANRMAANRLEQPAFIDIIKALGQWQSKTKAEQVLLQLLAQFPHQFKEHPELQQLWRAFQISAVTEVSGDISMILPINKDTATSLADGSEQPASLPYLLAVAGGYLHQSNYQQAAQYIFEALQQMNEDTLRPLYDRELLLLARQLYGQEASQAIQQRNGRYWLKLLLVEFPADMKNQVINAVSQQLRQRSTGNAERLIAVLNNAIDEPAISANSVTPTPGVIAD